MNSLNDQQKAMQQLLKKKKATQKHGQPAFGNGKARGSQVIQVKKQFTRRSS